MNSRRARGWLVAIAVVVVGLGLWLRLAQPSRSPGVPPLPTTVLPPAPRAALPTVQPTRATSEASDAIEDSRPGERNEAKPEAGTGEGQLEHMFRSVLEANAADLKLTPEQTDRLVSDYLEYQEIHAELAMRFLQEAGFDPSSVTLRLPAYPVEGKLLRDMFYRRLATDFPGGKATEINENLGGFFDNAFRGFGVTEQSFKVTRSPEVANGFEVQWEARIPEGQTTSALNPEVSFAGSSGTMLLYREQVESGEFRFLGPMLGRRFPDLANAPTR